MRSLAVGAPVAFARAIASAATAATGWTVYRDQVNQFRLGTPTGWIMVPPDRVLPLSDSLRPLRRKGKPGRRRSSGRTLADNNQSGENRALDGIQYPIRTSPILTDFFFVKDHLPKGLKSDSKTLSYIGDAIFGELAKQSGLRMTAAAPVRLRLHAGNAIEFSGTVPAVGFGGKKTGFAFYILLGPGNTEWQIEFRTDSRQLSADASLFRRIANSLTFG